MFFVILHFFIWALLDFTHQHYPPGTQEISYRFSSRNIIMKNSKKLEFPEGRERV
jgi:hypothetical protein